MASSGIPEVAGQDGNMGVIEILCYLVADRDGWKYIGEWFIEA